MPTLTAQLRYMSLSACPQALSDMYPSNFTYRHGSPLSSGTRHAIPNLDPVFCSGPVEFLRIAHGPRHRPIGSSLGARVCLPLVTRLIYLPGRPSVRLSPALI
ncbi:hypothetical protein EVAR_18882_1 [Eumeta japonica]|uniref:Uncharacterized protein n=1 Tax=Eumeta variegata TaxID=151549 RepID=A0A4C1V2H9_EUMVA|nr:hypothetical protein EVAR_18882_1 [Eumeta japonica]